MTAPRSLLPLALLLAALSAAANSPTQVRQPRGIRIGILGDQTLSADIEASYAALRRGVDLLSSESVDVVLHTGDLVESSLPPAQVADLFEQAAAILDRLPAPWFLTAGDHDVNPPVFQPDSPDRSRERLFQQLYGARVRAFAAHPWYSVDVRGFHLVSLYSFGALDSDSRFGDISLSRVYDDQFAWLQADLAASARARAIVVWVHQPLWYNAPGWRRVHALLRRYPVAAVVSGHFHYNQDGGELDGIHYYTVGAAGGLKKNGSRQAGSVDQVSVLSVFGPRRVSMQLRAFDKLPLRLTPRADMDRVQSLDEQFGNLFDFARHNPVFTQHGRLVADCAASRPAVLRIDGIGDPIDRPLDVQIGFSGAGARLTSPGFLPGRRVRVISGTECVLARSDGASAKAPGSGLPAPLWKAGVSGAAPAGTPLKVTVKTAFHGVSGELFVETTASTVVRACPGPAL